MSLPELLEKRTWGAKFQVKWRPNEAVGAKISTRESSERHMIVSHGGHDRDSRAEGAHGRTHYHAPNHAYTSWKGGTRLPARRSTAMRLFILGGYNMILCKKLGVMLGFREHFREQFWGFILENFWNSLKHFEVRCDLLDNQPWMAYRFVGYSSMFSALGFINIALMWLEAKLLNLGLGLSPIMLNRIMF